MALQHRVNRSGMIFAPVLLLVCLSPAVGSERTLPDAAASAMRKAAGYYRSSVAVHGGYVYYYSVDLKRRFGEGAASADQVWVQPPGTPTVGLAFLKAYRATEERFYLDAATEAAEALIYGQLKSGGWTNCIDFNPRGKRTALYRNGKGRGKNNSSLDDDQTQSAIRLLMHVDEAHGFKHERVHEAARIALDALLQAQFPNGGFPQVWTGPVERRPVVTANYPDYDWRTAGRIKNYWEMYTLNDGLAGTVAAVLIDAGRIYKDQKYRNSLKKLGEFLILAQMPDPQPAWAQQYNPAMQPIWARRFEPAAITGGESQDAVRTLMKIYRETGDLKYLEPIPRALAYLKKSQLQDGRLARFYELKTNRPLYMFRRGKTYTPTYDDSNLPAHYGFKIASRVDRLAREFAELKRSGASTRLSGPTARSLERKVRAIVESLDARGRWLSVADETRLVGQPRFQRGERYLASAVFSRNLETLSAYVAATKR